MKKLLYLFAISLFLVVISSCQRDRYEPTTSDADTSTEKHAITDNCGPDRIVGLFNANRTRLGRVLLYNNATNLYLHFGTVADEWRMTSMKLYVGDCANVPLDASGNPDYNAFPTQITLNSARAYVHPVAIAQVGKCPCIVASFTMIKRDANKRIIARDVMTLNIKHCVNECPVACEIGHRTQTQGGWGAKPNGGNNGAYLHANFATAFPSGVTIGDACGFTATFSSAQIITDFLPQGGTAAALTQSYTDPNVNINVFAGQVLTLAISVGMDDAIPSFSPSSTPLKNLVVASGDFAGMTVAQILALANKALAGCPTSYTYSQLNDVVDAINNNFDDGTTDNGFLVCPK